ncbi:MAG: hypothetical protein ACRDI0_02210 [Actinomycetota bacterium]
MPRYEPPPDLSPEEERAVLGALDAALEASRSRPGAWALAGRVEALRLGALQARRHAERPWVARGDAPFARRGTTPLIGRGDAR